MDTASQEPEAPEVAAAGAHRVLHSSTRVISVQRDSPVAFSPDGNRLAFAGENRIIQVNERRRDGQFTEYATLVGMRDVVLVLTFHPAIATKAGSSASASRLYAAGIEGIFMWDIGAGRVLPSMKILSWEGPGHEGPVESLCWAAGDTTLVSGAKDGNFKLWDAGNKFALMETNDDHKGSVSAIVYDEAHQLLATTGRDSQVKVWDAKTLQQPFRAKRADDSSLRLALKFNFEGHRGDVTSICFSQSGKALFSGARDNTVKIWDLVNGTELRSLSSHKADVRFVHPINQDKLLVTGAMDGLLCVWELGDIAVAKSAGDASIDAILNAKAQVLAVVDAAQAPADTQVHSFKGHSSGVYAAVLNPAYPVMASTGRNNELRLWDITDLVQPAILQEVVGHSGPVTAVQLCRGDQWIATASTDYHVYLFNTSNSTLVGKVNCGAGMFGLAVTPDNGVIYAGGNDFQIKAIPIAEGAPNRFAVAATLRGHAGKVNFVAVSPDARFVASASQDFSVRLWPVATASSLAGREQGQGSSPAEDVLCLASFQPHKGVPQVLAWSAAQPDLLATCSSDHDIATWRVGPGGAAHGEWRVEGAHAKLVSALCFGRGASSQMLFSGSWDYSVKVWNYSQGSQLPVKMLVGHSSRIAGLGVSTSGQVLTSASADGSLRVWDAVAPYECECECREEGNSRVVSSVDAGLAYFVSGSEDGCVRLWPIGEATGTPSPLTT